MSFACVLLLVLAPAQASSDSFPDLKVFPEDPQAGIRVEAGVVLRDLRTELSSLQNQRRLLERTTVGRELFGNGGWKQLFGFDPESELRLLAQMAAPSGKAVAAAVALLSTPQGPSWQGFLSIEPGFESRLEEAMQREPPPALSAQQSQEGWVISIGDLQLMAVVRDDGWLHLGPSTDVLPAKTDAPLFSEKLHQLARDLDGILFVRGGGWLAQSIASETEGFVAEIAATMRSAALGWRLRDTKSYSTRIMLELPQLAAIAPMARSSSLVNSLADLWGEDATAFLSASIPPALVAAALPIVQRAADDEGIILPDEVQYALSRLEGRVGVVHFGNPGDYAAGVTFTEEKAVQQLVPALYTWIQLTTSASKASAYVLEQNEEDGPVAIHLQPAPGAQGARLAAVGRHLLMVSQRDRLDRLAGRNPPEAKPEKVNAHPIAGPLTPLLRHTLERPAMVVGYSLVGLDGSSYDLLATLGRAASVFVEDSTHQDERPPFVQNVVDSFPTLMVLQSISLSFLYDVALSADLQGEVAVIDLAASYL